MLNNITEKEYQQWLSRNKGMNDADCQEMLMNARYQYHNNPECKASQGIYFSALYCTSRYISEELEN